MSLFSKSGIVNVKMVITEEKILSNIDKVQKMINPNSKKQIIQLEDDAFFQDLIGSIKTYLIEYPKKKNFPATVYRAAYELVEYATSQFEDNTKQIEELIRQREKNICSATKLKTVLASAKNKDKEWKENVKNIGEDVSEDIIDALNTIGRAKSDKSESFVNSVKLVNARIANLESNLHIEIDMERIEDRSKALSYIGIEVAEALKEIPAPDENAVVETASRAAENENYILETRTEVKPSLWQRIKNTKIIRMIRNITKIRIRIDVQALPEGRGENNN